MNTQFDEIGWLLEGKLMIDTLTKFFESYPQSFLDTNGPFRDGIPPELMSRMLEFRDRQLHVLSYAQHYRIDQETVQMLTDLAYGTKPAGRDEIYREAQFPFPALLVECPDPTGEGSYVALTTVVDDCMYTQRMIVTANGIVPSLLVLKSSGLKGELIFTPTYEAALLGPKHPDGEAAIKGEREVCSHFVAVVATMCSMLKYKGMIETEDVLALSRPERRRAEKAGKPLPDTLVTRVRLGSAGRIQLKATQVERDPEDPSGKRRAHWVAGHYMRHIARPEKVFRMPHIRGAGPVIPQLRRVELPEIADQLATKERLATTGNAGE